MEFTMALIQNSILQMFLTKNIMITKHMVKSILYQEEGHVNS